MSNQLLSQRLNVGVANIVVPGTSSGLVSANGLTGNTTGSAIASGFVGQILTSNGTLGSLSANTQTVVTSLSVPAGVWLFFGAAGGTPGTASGTSFAVGINNATNIGVPSAQYAEIQISNTSTAIQLPAPNQVTSISTTTTWNLVVLATGTTTMSSLSFSLNALRIA